MILSPGNLIKIANIVNCFFKLFFFTEVVLENFEDDAEIQRKFPDAKDMLDRVTLLLHKLKYFFLINQTIDTSDRNAL